MASIRFISYSHHLSTARPLGRRPYSAYRIATIWDAAGHHGRGKQRAGKSQTGPSIFPLELGHVPSIHTPLAKVPRPHLTPVRQGSAISMCTGSPGGRVSGSYQPCARWRADSIADGACVGTCRTTAAPLRPFKDVTLNADRVLATRSSFRQMPTRVSLVPGTVRSWEHSHGQTRRQFCPHGPFRF